MKVEDLVVKIVKYLDLVIVENVLFLFNYDNVVYVFMGVGDI